MAIVSHERGYLFIQVPRTACTAIAEKVLIPELDGRPITDGDILGPDGSIVVPGKHASLTRLLEHGLLSPEQRRSLLVFATVRNPFDSVVSRYAKLRRDVARELESPDSWAHRNPAMAGSVAFARDHSFDEWVAWQYRRPAALRRVRRALRSGALPEHYRGVDVVMRFERLQEDFDDVLRRLGVDRAITIPSYNRTTGRERDYRDYYTPRSRAIVERAHRSVIRRFGYRF